jgi:hypothetical protein
MPRLLSSTIVGLALLISLAAEAEGDGSEFKRFADFSLGDGTLADVQAKLGPSQLVQSGDAGEYVASVCYRSRAGYVAFLAGELDGPDHSLGGYWLSVAANRPPCAAWPDHVVFPRLALDRLHVGMTLAAFRREVGVPVEWHGSWVHANFESRRKLSATEISRLPPDVQQLIARGESQDFYDVVTSVSARFRSGRLIDLRVWKSETM